MDPSSVLLSHLADASVRILGLAVLALSGLWLGRVSSVSTRHAVWTVTLGAMLLLPCMITLLPELPLRVLPSGQAAPDANELLVAGTGFVLTGRPVPAPGRPWHSRLSWPKAALAVYGAGLLVMLGRLLLSWALVHRLLRSCVPVTDIRARLLLERHAGHSVDLVECPGIAVPVTAGALAPSVVLPPGWHAWDEGKLEATLAHESAHVRRRDPLIALMAALNTCLFWFHPLAWWLERRLGFLAEQAADDSTLLVIDDRRRYASALLEMAAVSGAGGGRLLWEAVAMARPSQLRRRIDRVLDESVKLSTGVSKGWWLALSLSGAVALFATAALRLEAAAGPEQESREGQRERLRAELRRPYERWLGEDVAYIISEEEREAFRRLTTPEEQEMFIEQFWLRRDPTPGTDRNEMKEEHYRRIAYANERFAWGNLPGWRSDRGRIYIALGPPDEIESHPVGYGTAPPYEIWRYRWVETVGRDVELTFYDPERTGEYRLLLPDPQVTSTVPAADSPSIPAGSWFACAVYVLGSASSFAQLDVALDRGQLRYQHLGSAERAVVHLYGRVTTPEGRPVMVFEDPLTVEVPPGVPATGHSSYRKRVWLDPGDYTLHLVVKEPSSGRTESQELGFSIPAAR